ncbi:uncharacterized protein PHACADRAFT_214023 [Phanerochaete carnosa HHB-10118-sp]|uniref:Stress-response A/B barrel domain-containing protein n=1 Tax=Phanerochaete carnosa (strain HHB-10118-sp) TaxID=650164 RepID=K5VU83_PHACS|nr:uncharacterized protein PHACADRAFT_214023 [Phanerochaete carnosa HHB-10118-sp]EKM50325.1 hypothetical protein PHACADRAFT_214023 [Phanerochaete carnosa HHB-10118-sp]
MSSSAAVSTSGSQHPPGTIVHLITLKYAPHVSEEAKQDTAADFLALKDKCRLPDGTTYIQSFDGGPNNSPIGLEKGMEYAFVLTFKSGEARDYYEAEDPAHQAFKAVILPNISDISVFDFETGAFARRTLG